MEQQPKWPRGAKNIIGLILILFLSGVFIFSAWTKFIAIEPFEWTFMDMGIPNGIAMFTARLFIGFEFLLGLFLLAHIWLSRFTYPVTLTFLVILTVYLGILIARQGNTGDCGCFGDTLRMSPLWAIIKNVGLIAIVYLLTEIYPVKPYRRQALIACIAGLASIAGPFIFLSFSATPQPIDLNALYNNPGEQPHTDLRKGKHVIAFMSLGCPHCRRAAEKFRDIYKDDVTTPIYMILNGPPGQEEDFFKETKARNVPHILFSATGDFIKMTGPYVPVIYWVNNSMKERKVSYTQLNAQAIKDWAKR